MADEDWDVLDGADAIVFGSRTYMGQCLGGASRRSPSRPGGRCLNGTWRDKVGRRHSPNSRRQGRQTSCMPCPSLRRVRRPAPHALGRTLRVGRRLEQRRHGSEDDLEQAGLLARDAARATDVDAGSRTTCIRPTQRRASTSGTASRGGHPAAQPLVERRQLLQERRQQLADGRVDVHGPRESCRRAPWPT